MIDLSQLSFGAPSWFWGLLLLPLLLFLFWRAERRGTRRLREFVSPRLLPQLAATVDRFRRTAKFVLLLLALALALVALAKPRWGYTYDETKRKGLDLLLAVDTSRSMLANDIAPNRLERVKLATQDLLAALEGDRIGLIAFAGRAFLQAPLTIDYGAALEAIRDLDTDTIPEGGSNLAAAVKLAITTYGKSAVGNRALIIFSDGEELSGDAAKAAKEAADAGVRIFAVGVGTPEGSLIPLQGEGGTSFVKDSKGAVVKTRLEEGRLREVAQATGGFYTRLEGGPATMGRIVREGLAGMQAGEIDVRMARRPIERYEWPLSGAVAALALSFLLRDRRRRPAPSAGAALASVALLLLAPPLFARAPGLELYDQEKYREAYEQFLQTLQKDPSTKATGRLQFDAGAAAYKMKEYNKALEAFSQALLSPEKTVQEDSHYNLGNTLYQRGEGQKGTGQKRGDWQDAIKHYDEALKLDPANKQAEENREFVKKKIEELEKAQDQPQPSPPPQDQQKKDKEKQDQSQDQSGQSQDQQQQQQGEQDQSEQEKGQQDQSGQGEQSQDNKEQPEAGASPSPGPGESPSPSPGSSPGESPSPGEGSPSPSPGGPSPSPSSSSDGEASPSPTAGENKGETEGSPSPSPRQDLSGELQEAGEPSDQESEGSAGAMAATEQPPEGEMTREQAERLLQSVRDEEDRVRLDERKASGHVYNDW